jgi:hypothetical protein
MSHSCVSYKNNGMQETLFSAVPAYRLLLNEFQFASFYLYHKSLAYQWLKFRPETRH